jgi:hypothetical protein
MAGVFSMSLIAPRRSCCPWLLPLRFTGSESLSVDLRQPCVSASSISIGLGNGLELGTGSAGRLRPRMSRCGEDNRGGQSVATCGPGSQLASSPCCGSSPALRATLIARADASNVFGVSPRGKSSAVNTINIFKMRWSNSLFRQTIIAIVCGGVLPFRGIT